MLYVWITGPRISFCSSCMSFDFIDVDLVTVMLPNSLALLLFLFLFFLLYDMVTFHMCTKLFS